MGAWQRGLPWGVLKSEGSVPSCRYQRALEKFSFSILLMQMEATVKHDVSSEACCWEHTYEHSFLGAERSTTGAVMGYLPLALSFWCLAKHSA